MQHLVVVRIDRNIRVNVAVARMHVQRHEKSAAQHALVCLRALIEDWCEYSAAEDLSQRRPELALPGHADRAILQYINQTQRPGAQGPRTQLGQLLFISESSELRQCFSQAGVEMGLQPAPTLAH